MSKGWEIKRLGDLCNLMTGGTPSRSKLEYFENGTIKWLVSGDIHKREIFDCEGRITKLGMDNSSTRMLPVNSVMIALNGQGKTRGTVALLRTEATCNQSLVSIYPKDLKKVLPEYIYCNLHGRYEEIRKITGDDDNDRRGLNMPLIRDIEIPLPSLPEQQRIVSILDEAFAAIAKAKANAEQNLKNAKELFESYLQGVFDPSASSGQGRKHEGWEDKKLGDVVEYDKNQSLHKNLPYIGLEHIESNSGRFLGSHKPQTVKSSTFYFNNHHVLYGRLRPYLNKVLLPDFEGHCSTEIFPIKVRKDIIREYLFYWLISESTVKKIDATWTGARMPRANMNQVLEFEFSFPSIKEQQTIVRKLDALKAQTQKLEAHYQKKIDDLEELKKSILQKAFAGELKMSEPLIKAD